MLTIPIIHRKKFDAILNRNSQTVQKIDLQKNMKKVAILKSSSFR